MYTVLTGTRRAPRVVVRPNRSLSAAGLVAVCLGLSLYLLALAALFWKTAWTVVPFLLAEMILVGATAWLLRRHARDREALVLPVTARASASALARAKTGASCRATGRACRSKRRGFSMSARACTSARTGAGSRSARASTKTSDGRLRAS